MSLFKSTAEVKKYISIDVNMQFSKLQPAIDLAEQDFIKPLLGAEFYDELSEAYTAANIDLSNLEDSLRAILTYVQRTLANYAAFKFMGALGVSVGDLGIQQQSSQNTQPAPAWKVNDLKLEYITNGDKSADLLLEFLEMAAVIPDGGDEDDRLYKSWYEDKTANTKLNGCIVYKTSIANQYIDILDSRRLFLRLKKRITEIEQGYIKRLICADQYAEITTQLNDNDLDDKNTKLCKLLEPIISKRALYTIFNTLPITITADGLFLSSVTGSSMTNQAKTQALQPDRDAYRKQLKEDETMGYEGDELELQKYLDANIETYPLIKNSPCWNAKKQTTVVPEHYRVHTHPWDKHFST